MKTVVMSNGRFGPAGFYLATIRRDDYLICADGGANHALSLELIPDVVVGDMDSIDASVRAELTSGGRTEFAVFSSDKDKSDTQLAVEIALEKKPSQIVITGALGGRFDHAMANVALLAGVPSSIPCAIMEPDVEIRLVRDRATIEGAGGRIVSLLPFGGDVSGVTLSGFKYPLRQQLIRRDTSLGLSNVMLGKTATIEVAEGMLLVIVPSLGVAETGEHSVWPTTATDRV